MSAQASLANLPASIRDLVLAASQGDEYFGRSEKDKSEVQEWTTKVAQGSLQHETGLATLESTLVSRTFLVGNDLTAADVAVFGSLYPILAKRSPQEYYAQPCITRYFDHLQSLPSVQKGAVSVQHFSPVSFDLENMPKPERKAEAPKKKAKAPAATSSEQAPTAADTSKPAPAAPAQPPTVATEQPPTKEERKETEKKKKEKKEPKEKPVKEANAGGKKGGQGAAAEAESGEPIPSMIDLRVGHIIEVQKHPDADGLYVEQIDIAEETGPRTVVSGLVNYIPIEKMRDAYVIVVCNLKPASMRGVKSFAMLLCASSKEGKEGGIEFVNPPPGAKPGDRVYFEGFEENQPLSQLNPKKKIFETIQPGFTTLDTCEAAWVNKANGTVHKIRTKDGYCKSNTLVGASLS